MCCRYYMEMSPRLRPIVEAANRSRLYRSNIARIAKPLTTEGEIFPDMLVPVLASSRSGAKAVFPMIWGYRVQGLGRLVANARAETAAEKPSFRDGEIFYVIQFLFRGLCRQGFCCAFFSHSVGRHDQKDINCHAHEAGDRGLSRSFSG